jgi:hypothetical protein
MTRSQVKVNITKSVLFVLDALAKQTLIEQLILDTNAGKKLSEVATDV